MVADMRKLSGFDLHVYCIRNDLRARRPTDGVLAAQSTRLKNKQCVLQRTTSSKTHVVHCVRGQSASATFVHPDGLRTASRRNQTQKTMSLLPPG